MAGIGAETVLRFDHTNVRPGDKVTALGEGCQPRSHVSLASEGKRVGEAVAGRDGRFRTGITFPELKPGRRAVTATCGVTMVGYVHFAVSSSNGGSATIVAVLLFFILVGAALLRWQYTSSKRIEGLK